MNWRGYIIRTLGGYESITERDRAYVLTQAVKDLFNTIGAEDILREEKGTWYVGDKPLPPDIKNLLIAEAEQLSTMRLWQVLQKDIRYQANKQMFLLAKDERDMMMGKMFLYVLDCINTRLKSLRKKSGHFQS